MSRVLIGIGNPDRGDDAAGWEVAGRVRGWDATRTMAGSVELIDRWDSDDDVVIVDAMHGGGEVGHVARFDLGGTSLPSGRFTSTHAFGPAELGELARVLGRLPASLTVIGIEAGTTGLGEAMSPPVADAVNQVVKELDHA